MVWWKNLFQMDRDPGGEMEVNHGMMEYIQESNTFVSIEEML